MYRPVSAGNESTECVLAAGLGGAGDRHRCLGTMGAHRVYGGAPTLPARLLPLAVTTVPATHPSCRTATASRYDPFIPPTLLVELLPLCAGQEEGDGHAPASANRAVVGGLPPVPAAARNGRCNGQPTAITRYHSPARTGGRFCHAFCGAVCWLVHYSLVTGLVTLGYTSRVHQIPPTCSDWR